jgi:hypothetical protein
VNLLWLESPALLLVAALAAYRLTRLWTTDTLPPLPRVRATIERWAGERWSPAVRLEMHRRGLLPRTPDEVAADQYTVDLYDGEPPLAKLATCPWCSGFWISAGVVLASSLLPAWLWWPLAAALALSAVAGLISSRDD